MLFRSKSFADFFEDGQLQLLIDSVLFNPNLDKKSANDLVNKLALISSVIQMERLNTEHQNDNELTYDLLLNLTTVIKAINNHKNIARQDPAFGHPEKFCSDISKTNWESATITTLDDKIIPYITNICKRDPRSGNVVTGGIVSCKDSKWLMSWTINRQGQFKQQDPEKVCVWVYGLFTDVPGDYIKKPMKDCTGEEITAEWLYHIGVPTDEIPELAKNSALCVPTMMPYITAFFMPRTKGDRPDVIPDGCINFAFLGQFADTPRDTVFTTEYSVRTAMEAVYGDRKSVV